MEYERQEMFPEDNMILELTTMQIYIKHLSMTKAIIRAMATHTKDTASTQIPAPLSSFDLTNVCPPLFCFVYIPTRAHLTPSDVSKVISIDDVEGIGQLFDSFCVSQSHNGAVHPPSL